MTPRPDHQVCDYEGSAYRTEFWGAGRDYEDAAERVALKHLLPPTGSRLIDIGGGYGRLVPLYRGYDEVIIFDYALSQLREAQKLWGPRDFDRPKLIYVAGDYYQFPFRAAAFETAVLVRALHHAKDAPAVLRGVAEILAPGGTLVLEFANKRNLKAILRYLVRRQSWSPFERDPVEFVPLNFDFHPAWIARILRKYQLRPQRRRAVSTFRLAFLKKLVPTPLLVALDRLFQPLGALLPLSPSVFVCSQRTGGQGTAPPETLFRCIACGSSDLSVGPDAVVCRRCQRSYPVRDGIYDFRPAHEASAHTHAAAQQPHGPTPPVSTDA